MLATALEYVVKGIVDHPEDVTIRSATSRGGRAREGRGQPADRGRVIGRGGHTAKALRTVVAALADGRRVRGDVADD